MTIITKNIGVEIVDFYVSRLPFNREIAHCSLKRSTIRFLTENPGQMSLHHSQFESLGSDNNSALQGRVVLAKDDYVNLILTVNSVIFL